MNLWPLWRDGFVSLISREHARRVLEGQPPGTSLIRLSDWAAGYGCCNIVIAYVSREQKVLFHFLKTPMGSTDEDDSLIDEDDEDDDNNPDNFLSNNFQSIHTFSNFITNMMNEYDGEEEDDDEGYENKKRKRQSPPLLGLNKKSKTKNKFQKNDSIKTSSSNVNTKRKKKKSANSLGEMFWAEFRSLVQHSKFERFLQLSQLLFCSSSHTSLSIKSVRQDVLLSKYFGGFKNVFRWPVDNVPPYDYSS